MINRKMTLKQKFFIMFVLVVMIPSIMMGSISYIIMSNILTEQHEKLLYDNTKYAVEILEREINQFASVTKFFFRNEDIIEMLENEDKGLSSYERVLIDDKIDDMFLVLGTFDILSAIEVAYIGGGDEKDSEFWFGTGKPYISMKELISQCNEGSLTTETLIYAGLNKSVDYTKSKKKIMVFRQLIVNDMFNPIGYMYIELNPAYFGKLLQYDESLSNTTFTLVDNSGVILWDQDSRYVGAKYQTVQQTGNTIEVDLPLSNDWRLISQSESVDINKSYKSVELTIILATLGTFFLSTLLLIFMTKRIVNPIQKLSTTMDKIASGNELSIIENNATDEIGQLTNSFNRMTLRVKESFGRELEQTKRSKTLEYQALQAQINPHFLYNTLNTLSWMARMQKASTIEHMVDALWDILKRSSSGSEISKLEDEIELLKAYGDIQKVRYKSKFELAFEIDEKWFQIQCPKFFLQPFVENAIFHGIEPKKGLGIIKVTCEEETQVLVIRVIDDGVGMEQQKVDTILCNNQHRHSLKGLNNIGIVNVHERIQLLYGKAYGVTIKSVVNEGTTVEVRLPIDINEQGEEIDV